MHINMTSAQRGVEACPLLGCQSYRRFCSVHLGAILTKSRCVAAVIQDATSKPYTMNIMMKYWEGNRQEPRIVADISLSGC